MKLDARRVQELRSIYAEGRTRLRELGMVLAAEFGCTIDHGMDVVRGKYFNAIKAGRERCKHCRKNYQCRPRGLCWPCFEDESIRHRYPVCAEHTRRGVGHSIGPSLTPEPTATRPGSEERIAVLMDRATRREALKHPQDAGL